MKRTFFLLFWPCFAALVAAGVFNKYHWHGLLIYFGVGIVGMMLVILTDRGRK